LIKKFNAALFVGKLCMILQNYSLVILVTIYVHDVAFSTPRM